MVDEERYDAWSAALEWAIERAEQDDRLFPFQEALEDVLSYVTDRHDEYLDGVA